MPTRLSSEVTATTELPAASSVSAAVISPSEISVSWTNNDDSPDGRIDVERSTDGFATVTTVASGLSPSATTFTDSAPPVAEPVEYRVERTTDHATATSDPSPAVGIGEARTALASGSANRSLFTATAAFRGGDVSAAADIVGSQQVISAVQARTQAAAGVVGSAVFIGSLSRTQPSRSR